MTASTSLRLLAALAPQHAYGWLGDGEGTAGIRIVTRRRNVSVETGCFPPEAAETLVARGLAIWEAPGPARRARLTLTDRGRDSAALASGPEALEAARLLHGDVGRRGMIVEGEAALVVVDDAESPLVWLSKRRGRDGKPLIGPAELEAGERLRRDLTLAQTLPSVTSRWSGMPGAGGSGPSPGHMSDLVLAARQRVARAMDAVGPEFSGLLVDVCGFLKGLERIESERNWPRRSARIVLDLALVRLARHYGIGTHASGPEHAKRMRHWGAQDYRPKIEA
ncbi:MAG: putative ATPase involved in replication initiation [Hyphomicrobiales bacterium]|nr:putative ATPase involved in replication initiation [Hyphomicrobiales bacterium]